MIASRLVIAPLALIVVAGGLAACGSSDGGSSDNSADAFCSDLGAAVAQFSTVSDGDLSVIGTIATTFDGLKASAPDEISDDVTKISSALDEVAAAMAETDLSSDDAQGAAGLAVLGALSSITDQLTALQTYAQDTCGLDLSAVPSAG